MDILLERGDHSRDRNGIPRTVTGNELLIQQALLRLSIPKGSFVYDKSLGSELHRLGGISEQGTQRAAMSYATEALRGLPQVKVIGAQCQRRAPDVLAVAVELAIQGKNMILEVMMDEKL